MSKFTIEAKKRDRAGKGAARAARRQGFIPGVLYGNKQDPVLINVTPLMMQKAFETGTFYSNVYEVKVDGGESAQALARDVQFHPVSDRVESVDFLRVTDETKVNVNVPVRLTGEDECVGIRRGGLVSILRTSVELIAPVKSLPEFIEINVADKDVGDAARISEATLPEGVTPAITDRDFVIANILAPKLSAAADEEEETEDTGEEETDATEEEATDSES